MLNHALDKDWVVKRVVIIGAYSFIGKALVANLEQETFPVLRLARADVDLSEDLAGEKLAALLQPIDTVITIAAKAPCRNVDDFLENAKITRCLTKALEAQPVAHLVNISSDAVYPDQFLPLSEEVPAAPGSMHGAMHLAREIALTGLGLPTATLRPTLIYGANDPHGGYGPNMFRRKSNAPKAIKLFGEGEELRDHVSVDDVAELVKRVMLAGSTGVLNIATGAVTSFHDIAQMAVKMSGNKVKIVGSPRSGPMPHNGCRPFDPKNTFKAFPDFTYTELAEGMALAQELEFGRG
ncbi:NAD-dependent epimerase/dehydratase family protein [Planktomarina sp.]|nr:NAD-dependent epimerase/dehydratase family protein [Planktomarina sp.]